MRAKIQSLALLSFLFFIESAKELEKNYYKTVYLEAKHKEIKVDSRLSHNTEN